MNPSAPSLSKPAKPSTAASSSAPTSIGLRGSANSWVTSGIRGIGRTRNASPAATWANVKAAVDGANIVVYFGHGNGYPNPYTTVEYTDRVNGWGLNRTTSGGDGDDGYSTMAYCGEKALMGTITSTDGATQRTYCTPGPITSTIGSPGSATIRS